MVKLLPPLLVLGFFVVPQAAYIVAEWEQAIVTRFGQPIRTVREPGLYFKVPIAHTVTRFDKRILATDAVPGEYLASDKKRLLVDHISRWAIADPLQFFRTMRDERGAVARLNDIVSGRLRQEIAKEDFKSIIREKRAAIMEGGAGATRGAAAAFRVPGGGGRLRRGGPPP